MIAAPSELDVQELIEATPDVALTIYLHVHSSGQDKRQDPIRLRNLLKEARTLLEARGVDTDELVQPIDAMLKGPAAISAMRRGVGIFRSPEVLRVFAIDAAPREFVAVDDRFHVRPLITDLQRANRFYLLALSLNSVRCMEITPNDHAAVDLPDAPGDLEEARGQIAPDRAIQFHSGTASHGPSGERPAAFHGQGAAADDSLRMKWAEDFCRQVDQAVYHALEDRHVPLLLAGVDWLVATFRKSSSWPRIHPQSLSGNFEHLSEVQLIERGQELLKSDATYGQSQLIDRFRTAQAAGRTTDNLAMIVHGAREGRIDQLLVADNAHAWGSNPSTHDETLRLHDRRQPEDVDLVEHAVMDTLRHDGRVFPLARDQMPLERPLLAVLRY